MDAYDSPSLLRRVAAMVYDTLLVIALLMLSIAPPMLIAGEAINDRWWTFPYIVVITFLFFFGFWRKAGQTLGMRTWSFKLVDASTGGNISFKQALIRFAVAIPSLGMCGIGYIWVLFDKEKMSMPDRASGTRLVLLKKTKK